jgi:S1-C subfamily serine protease
MEFIRYLLAEETRDETLPVVVVRDDIEQTLMVEPALLVERLALLRSDPLRPYGFSVDLSAEETMVVTRVSPRTPAFIAGLKPGDVIVKFNDRKPLTAGEFAAYLDEAATDPVALTVRRDGRLTALEWEADIAMDSTSSPSTTTTVPDRKRLERMSRLREREEMRRQ